MTDPELQGIAAQTLNMAKRELEQEGALSGLLAMYYQGHGLHRVTMVEDLLISKLGPDWSNDEKKKTVAFEVMREATGALRPDAVVYATGVNRYQSTAKLEAMGKGAVQELLAGGPERRRQAVAEGLLTVEDAVMAMAQTPRRMCMYTQVSDGSSPLVQWFNQSEFQGRLKLYPAEEPCPVR